MKRTITKIIAGQVIVPDISLTNVKTIMIELKKTKTEKQITQFLFDNKKFFGDITFAFSEESILNEKQ